MTGEEWLAIQSGDLIQLGDGHKYLAEEHANAHSSTNAIRVTPVTGGPEEWLFAELCSEYTLI